MALCICFTANGQFGQRDSVRLINGWRKLEGYQNKLKPDFGFDARRTFLEERWIAVGGLRGGAAYRRIHRFGLGIYFINNRIFSRSFNFPISTDLVEFEFGYSALYYERVLYFDRKWEFSAGCQLGGGKVGVFYNPDGLNERVLYTEIPFSTAELVLSGSYNVLHWLALGGGFGYRGVAGLDGEVNQSFSGAVAVVNIQLKFFKLVRSFFDPEAKYEY